MNQIDKGSSLFMLRVPVKMPQLFKIAERSYLSSKSTDLCYLLHCMFGELFRDKAPSTFSVDKEVKNEINVFAYSNSNASDLKEIAKKENKKLSEMINWDKFESKLMPDTFPKGSQYRFRIRVCPVIRKARGSKKYKSGAEVDVFLSEAEKVDSKSKLDRKAVYINWFKSYLKKSGVAVDMNQIKLIKMKLSKLIRRRSNRSVVSITRPDTVFEGCLTVEKPELFRKKLKTGFGRHSSFGFGMMLLSK